MGMLPSGTDACVQCCGNTQIAFEPENLATQTLKLGEDAGNVVWAAVVDRHNVAHLLQQGSTMGHNS